MDNYMIYLVLAAFLGTLAYSDNVLPNPMFKPEFMSAKWYMFIFILFKVSFGMAFEELVFRYVPYKYINKQITNNEKNVDFNLTSISLIFFILWHLAQGHIGKIRGTERSKVFLSGIFLLLAAILGITINSIYMTVLKHYDHEHAALAGFIFHLFVVLIWMFGFGGYKIMH